MCKEITITVRNKGELETWEESYVINDDPNCYANRLIDNYNATLRPGEKPRELVEVSISETMKKSKMPHEWIKQNIVTVIWRGVSYDIMRCAKCGITGKRFGLSGVILRDSKYKAKKYNNCDATK